MLKRGRPLYYDHDLIREVWVFLQEQKARTGLSILRLCKQRPLRFAVLGRGGQKRDYTIVGGTLRRLYYRAEKMLKVERHHHHGFLLALQRAGATSPLADMPLPTASFWNEDLQRRLAEPA